MKACVCVCVYVHCVAKEKWGLMLCVPFEFYVSLNFVRVPVRPCSLCPDMSVCVFVSLYVSLSLSSCVTVYVGCIIGRSRPDSARGVHQAVTRRDREESRVAVRRPF